MNRSIADKIVAFLAQRGEQGAESSELAEFFLHAVSAPPQLAEKLIQGALSGDPRIQRRPDGRWAAIPAAPSVTKSYAVIEIGEAAIAGGGCLPVEWAGVLMDSNGKMLQAAATGIKPVPWPKGLLLPEHLRGSLGSAPAISKAVSRAAEFARGAIIVAFNPGAFQVGLTAAQVRSGGDAPVLSLKKLVRQLLGSEAHSPEALAGILGIPVRETIAADDRARFTSELLSAMLTSSERLGLGDPDEWMERQSPPRLDVDFSGYEFDRETVGQLPDSPGIYIMRDANGEAVYVGKASNLRERVKSYFRRRIRRDEKTEEILAAVSRLDFEETGSELGALLAEQAAIRTLQPRINGQFEVHERSAAAKAPHRRMVLLLPAPEPESTEIFLLHGDRALRRVMISRGEPERLRPSLEEFFFAAEPPPPASGADAEDLEIAWSWHERHRDSVNAFDVDLAGGLDGSMRLVSRYLGEEPSEGRVFHV